MTTPSDTAATAAAIKSRVHVSIRVRPPKQRPASSPTRDDGGRPRSAAAAPGPRSLQVEDPHTVAVLSRTPAISERCWGSESSLASSTPLHECDSALGSTSSLATSSSSTTSSSAAVAQKFTFDQVFAEDATQAAVYAATVAPLVDSFVAGFNCTVFVYGQTGSGKTYTMGTDRGGADGMVPRALEAIFARLASADTAEFEASLAMVEIYNEEIMDLLRPAGAPARGLPLREDALGSVSVAGATSTAVAGVADCLRLLDRGFAARSTGSTAMNQRSSRSHAIVTLTLSQRRTAVTRLESRFHFVDLAGSERVNKARTAGDRRREGISINQGLLVLGQVIHALASETPAHVPYRDSKLTRLLQPALGGNSRTAMLACVSADEADYGEAVSTLRYAARARAIRNTCTANVAVDAAADAEGQRKAAVALALENAALRNMLEAMQAKLAAAMAAPPPPVPVVAQPPPPVAAAEEPQTGNGSKDDLGEFLGEYQALCARVEALRGRVRSAVERAGSPTGPRSAWM
ncbi:hypothetical protein H9P43_004032 [Blastocladiella emersonii ATCC 22665]|nr:hypothetical protein H9P43_004032 [Blastocladiella emersonii ATCC 22665]